MREANRLKAALMDTGTRIFTYICIYIYIYIYICRVHHNTGPYGSSNFTYFITSLTDERFIQISVYSVLCNVLCKESYE